MQEIFENISDQLKKEAEFTWHIALSKLNAIEAANFLNDFTNNPDRNFNEEEIEFLRFYFRMKMEMMKE